MSHVNIYSLHPVKIAILKFKKVPQRMHS
jgi:hypothetical protein